MPPKKKNNNNCKAGSKKPAGNKNKKSKVSGDDDDALLQQMEALRAADEQKKATEAKALEQKAAEAADSEIDTDWDREWGDYDSDPDPLMLQLGPNGFEPAPGPITTAELEQISVPDGKQLMIMEIVEGRRTDDDFQRVCDHFKYSFVQRHNRVMAIVAADKTDEPIPSFVARSERCPVVLIRDARTWKEECDDTNMPDEEEGERRSGQRGQWRD